MKKFILFLILLPSIAIAHSQYPTVYGGKKNPLDAAVTSQKTIVPIVIRNVYDEAIAFDIFVDDVLQRRTDLVSKNNEIHIKAIVTMEQPMQPETHKICSVSVNEKNPSFKTRICTKAKLIWVK